MAHEKLDHEPPSGNARMQAPPTYRRIVIKAGTSLLTYGGRGPNREIMSSLVAQMAQLRQAGAQLLLVSSGAIAAGRSAIGEDDNHSVQFSQALAAIGQSHLMNIYQELFSEYSITVGQVLLTMNDIGERRTQGQRLRDLNARNTLSCLLGLGVIPIVNENDVVAVDELAGAGFGDNDNIAARVARAADAELLILLGTVNGLFTADPVDHPAAALIPVVPRVDRKRRAIAGPPRDRKGRGGMSTKIEAADFATKGGVDVIIASGLEPDVLLRLARGDRAGTYFPASRMAKASRKNWLKRQVSDSGSMVVDDGAARALMQKNRSLLPVGVTKVVGTFKRGDAVKIRNERGIDVAVGVANYSSVELEKIMGLRSSRVAEKLGYQYSDEVVQRRDMIRL